jgi:maltose alpha-D-glucosyltransferase/alpha-amylase
MSGAARNDHPPSSTTDPLWYKDAIIYELHVRAFHDSNGDGIGDFRGLLQKLDYLQDLGVTALWLLPFYPSPLRDDGYDIANYTEVNPLYGNLLDFQDFLHEAHRRGLRVITELVVNHTSDQHPWFQQARYAPPGSPERGFYVWSDTSDSFKEARIIFKDFEPSNWSWDAVANAFYWHRFFSHQPDLNFDNPEVHKAIFQVLDFWLGMGIDGLRLDAIPYLYEREGTNCENLPETHQFLKKLRRHVDERFQARMLLAEANQWPEDAVAYFGEGDECHAAFHFPVMPRLFMGIRMEERLPIVDILQQTPSIPDSCQWALFLRNHDELTLEMVTDEDRDYMYRVYAQDPQARINLGIRRRLAPLLENHRGKIELMNGLLFSLPGTPVIYYGDEIGMGDNIYLGDRNGVRTPMQWSPDRNAGFSRANPQRLYLPAIIDPAYHFEAVNVEAQQNNPHSLLWWMKRLISLRKRYRAFSRGSLEFLYPDNHKVLAFLRRYEDECLLVVANLSRHVQCAELDLSAYKGMVPREMLGRTKFPAITDRPYFLTLGAHAFYWFALQPVRSDPLQRVGEGGERMSAVTASLYVRGNWDEVLHGKSRDALQEILPHYLQGSRWFTARPRQLEAAMLLETIAIPYASTTAHLALVQVEYTEGDSETYLLPLAYAGPGQMEHIQATLPQSIVGVLHLVTEQGEEKGVLYDPLGEPSFSQALLEALLRQQRFSRAGGELVGVALLGRGLPTTPQQDLPGPLEPGAGSLLSKTDQSNTTLVYGDHWLLKLFRRIEEGVNPELELGRFLTEKTSFHQVPPVHGYLEYRRSWGAPMTVAVLEGYIAHEADGWQFTRDALGRYFEQTLMRREETPPLLFPAPSPLELLDTPMPKLAQELIGPYLEAARVLGQRTAEFHRALASVPSDPAFAPEPFTALGQRSLYQSMRSQIRQTFHALRQQLKEQPLPEDKSFEAEAGKLLGYEESLIRRARSILDHKLTGQRMRTHGDYHLGQVLYTGRDFFVIDLEGESDRSLSARRHKRSPLRDVACMMRSFHYAVYFTLRNGGLRGQDIPSLEPWARFWYGWVSVAFVKAYLEGCQEAVFLPRTREEMGVLLDFYLLKRAVKELHAELARHSERVNVPLHGLLQIMEAGDK